MIVWKKKERKTNAKICSTQTKFDFYPNSAKNKKIKIKHNPIINAAVKKRKEILIQYKKN